MFICFNPGTDDRNPVYLQRALEQDMDLFLAYERWHNYFTMCSGMPSTF